MNREEYVTLDEAEQIRNALNLSEEHFSLRLGFSARAYYQARQRKHLSWWMAREISLRFGHRMQEIRQCQSG